MGPELTGERLDGACRSITGLVVGCATGRMLAALQFRRVEESNT
jgi:hypothetical protein